jgi:hypothetical protein
MSSRIAHAFPGHFWLGQRYVKGQVEEKMRVGKRIRKREIEVEKKIRLFRSDTWRNREKIN